MEIPPPVTQLIGTTVFQDNATANAAMMGIYEQMHNNGDTYQFSFIPGISADEIRMFPNYEAIGQFYVNGISPTNLLNASNLWTPAYNYIFQSNAVLEGVKNSAALSVPVKRQLTGEAEFMRAFWYFYLVNLYGDIPVITTTDYKTNALALRLPVSKVYQQIVADLTDAIQLLNGDFVDADGVSTTTERVRPNKWAAQALLARVYLFTNDYPNAETTTSAVIDNTAAFSLVPDVNAVFLKNSPEEIWTLMPVLSSSYNTSEGQNFILTTTPRGDGYNCSLISGSLLNAFENGDKRRVSWIDSITVGTTQYLFPYKYKVAQGNPVTEYTCVLRLAEQYLIRAEARAQQNEISGSQADLNRIRSRAGLPPTAAGDQASLLNAILHERQIELFTEFGHRWLDLKRTGKIDSVMGAISSQKGGSWNSNAQLYPIPQSERNSDANLTQNKGY